MEAAVSRGQSAMNCPSATGELLSQEFTQAIQTPIPQAGYSGLFTIGVTGCGTAAGLSGFLRDGGRQLYGARRWDPVSETV